MIINTGFEFETQAISMALWKKNNLVYQPEAFFKKTLKDYPKKVIVQLYPDDFKKTTAFYNQQVQPFVQKYSYISSISINAFNETFIIPFNNNLQHLFTHAEFIVTYPVFDEIACTKKSLLNYLLNKTKDAVIDMRDSFNDLFSNVDIINKENLKIDDIRKRSFEFPYSWISKSRLQDIIFFFNEDPKYFMSKFRFVAQTTFGVPLVDAPKVMKCLTQAFTEVSESTTHDKIEIVESYSITIFKKYQSLWETDPNIMKSFLFLLFYSAITSYSRKSQALFVIRLTMFQLANLEIHKDDIDLLYSVLIDDYFSDPIAKYITDIFSHEQNESQHSRRVRQNVADVTTFPYNKKDKIVFIEYRGFKKVLTHQCKGTTKSNLYLNDILFCKPF